MSRLPSCWAWQQYAPPPCLKNCMHYLQIYWPSSATKMKLLKFSFSFPCLPLFYFWVFPFLSIFFFVTFCWNGKQSNNSLFFFLLSFSPPCLVYMHAQSYVVDVVTTTATTNYKVFRLFSFCPTWTATINWNYTLKIAARFWWKAKEEGAHF